MPSTTASVRRVKSRFLRSAFRTFIATVFLIAHFGVANFALPSDSQRKGQQNSPAATSVQKQGCAPLLTQNLVRKRPKLFHHSKNERYRRSPLVAYDIEQTGKIANLKLVRSSGVRSIDLWVLSEVRDRKYMVPPGCGRIHVEEDVTINFDDK